MYNTNDLNFDKNCFECFLKCGNDIEKIKIYATHFGLSIRVFLNCVQNYINKNMNKPDFVKYLNVLSTLTSEDEVIKFFESSKVDYKYLNNNLLSYYVYYNPSIFLLNNEELSRMREVLRKYEIYLYRKQDPIRTNVNDDSYASNIIKEFINSKYSKKRFCFNNSIGCQVFKSYILKVKKNDKDLYNQYISNLELKEKIKKETIQNDIHNILNKLKEDYDNFYLLDLCLMTNYSISELIEEADKILDMEDIKIFRSKIRGFNYKDTLHDERLTRLFRTNFTYNINNQLIKISDQDIYTIVDYLNYYDIPICNETFREGCIKLIKSRQKNIVKTK